MSVALVPYGAWLPLVFFLSTPPAFETVLHYSLLQHQIRKRTTADERRARHFSWLLANGSMAKNTMMAIFNGLLAQPQRQIHGLVPIRPKVPVLLSVRV
jgi:hypothetical protein